jgi:hydrogenase expression/formation protein HypC
MMCLAVPAKLIRTNGIHGLADLHGNRLPISTVLLPEAQVGDWVLVHAGFAIQKLAVDDARETFSLIQELDPPAGGES